MSEEGKSVNILKFLKPEIVDEQQLNIEEYGKSDLQGDNKLVGHMDKRFVRVDTDAIYPFIKEIKNNPSQKDEIMKAIEITYAAF